MAIHFTKQRMDEVVRNHMLWWNGHLGRPLIKATVVDAYELTPCASPVLTQGNCHDFSLTPEQVIDAWEAQLSGYEFCGDAFPFVNLDAFGPGVVAGFCGSAVNNSTGAVWFEHLDVSDINEVHVKYDRDNVWVNRIKAIAREGVRRWQGQVIIGFPDFGGVLDIVASLISTEELLFALIEQPEEVKRLVKEIQTCWYEAYEDFAGILKEQGAFTDWNGLLSTTPSYVPQCDFSIMINSEMFREFALDTLREDVNRLDNVIYHLDGSNALHHLKDILSIEGLKAVQYVQGEGNGEPVEWLDVYQKIHAAGKRVQICGTPQECLEGMRELPGIPVYARLDFKKSEQALMEQILAMR